MTPPPILQTARLIVRVPTIDDARSMLAYRTRNRAHLAPSSPTPPAGSDTVAF